MKLGIGSLVSTSYNTGPYRVRQIERGCTCPAYHDYIQSAGGKDAPRRKPHLHLTCTGPDGKGTFWLEGYDEETLVHCNGKDHLIIHPSDRPVQLTLF